MSISDYATLGSIRWQARQQADLEGNDSVSDPEFNQYLSQSYKRLYNMLVAAYGNDYNVAPLFQFNVSNSQYYPLPNGQIASLGTTSFAPALFKLIGVDLQYSSSPSGFITLKRFEEINRNRYGFPNSAVNLNGYSNLRYRLSGSNIEFVPIPMAGQLVQLKYIPKPTQLQYINVCATVGSMSLSMNDVTDLAVGMSVQGPSGESVVQLGSKITVVDAAPINQVTLSLPTLSASPTQTLAFWIDSVVFDGVSGWEQFMVLDSAIKANIKQENPVQELINERAMLIQEIDGLAEGRDVGEAFHVSDVMGANSYDDYGGSGFGSGYY